MIELPLLDFTHPTSSKQNNTKTLHHPSKLPIPFHIPTSVLCFHQLHLASYLAAFNCFKTSHLTALGSLAVIAQFLAIERFIELYTCLLCLLNPLNSSTDFFS